MTERISIKINTPFLEKIEKYSEQEIIDFVNQDFYKWVNIIFHQIILEIGILLSIKKYPKLMRIVLEKICNTPDMETMKNRWASTFLGFSTSVLTFIENFYPGIINKLIERFIKEKHVELSAKKQRELIAPTMSEYNKMTFWEQNEVGHRLHFFNNNDYFCNGNFRRKWRTQQRKSIQINDNL
jgi:hypothetical protein